MSISEKIKLEISSLDIDEKDKILLMNFLTIEDSGIYRFKKEYDKILGEYFKNIEGGES